MHNALAIFRKDLYRLYVQVFVFWLLLVLAAVIEPYGAYWRERNSLNVSDIALLACCFLVAGLIHQEPLPGDRQYWLTRPFTTLQLLSEKTLFLVCCVVLPVLLHQMVCLAILGISPLHYASALLWRMIVFTAVVVLPAASVAALTRNLTQFLLAAFLVVAALIVLGLLFPGPIFAGPWLGAGPAYLLLALAGTSLLALQYTWRATLAGRLMLGATVILFFFASKTELDDAVFASVLIARVPAPALPPSPPRPFDIIAIPIRIDGVSAQAEAMSGSVHLTVNGAPGPDGAIRDFAAGNGRLTIPLLPNAMAAPVHLRGWVGITLFERVYAMRLPDAYEYLRVPGIGVCTQRNEGEGHGNLAVICLAPSAATGLAMMNSSKSLTWIIPPGIGNAFVDFTQPLQPVMRFTVHAVSTQGLVIVRTVANLRAEFDFPDLRLADFRVSQ